MDKTTTSVLSSERPSKGRADTRRTIVRRDDRRRQVGRRLLSEVEALAARSGYGSVWVATGDEAVAFYRRCGWQGVERLRLASTGIPTTILTKNVITDSGSESPES